MTDPHDELTALDRYDADLAGHHGPGARALAEHLERLIDEGVLHPRIRLAIVESRQAAELEHLVTGIASSFATPTRILEGVDATDVAAWFAEAVEAGRYPPGSTWAGVLDAAAGMVATEPARPHGDSR
jgi:hypothetical protein